MGYLVCFGIFIYLVLLAGMTGNYGNFLVAIILHIGIAYVWITLWTDSKLNNKKDGE